MELSALREEMHELFGQVRKRFEQVDQRFEQVDQRFEQVDQRFEQVDQRFEQVDQRFEQVRRQFAELSAQIATEALTTRRHFDMAVEQMKAERNVVLDQSLAARERLDDHERRITKLERRK